ncbi:hypothetical protein EX30DRAFT_306724 [Ascodesmis nigricans]|uniref:Chromatin-remodeling ATPase INO80 n=1 Tax=Ascodesmis nigricans TaxID=341454 RepID=A0A4S2MWL1_9PEZI|nr:hypothetical protein EX30DRAFT_306724 [Ascodesmis nigricans]
MLDTQDSDFSAFPQEEELKKVRKKPGPKKGARASLLPKDAAAAEEAEFAKPEPVKDEPYVPHVSKQYNQLYDQIWRDIARKEIPRLARTQQAMLSIKQANLRKTAQLASKEAQRWKLRTTKNIKDTQARAKRCMREMLTFWKRNEREEREMRRRADKEAVERAKREEEKREATRQARKLNFLISQTELYSHFIGRKIKTDDIEKSTGSDNVGGSGEIPTATAEDGKVPAALEGKPTGEAVTDFEKLDFDDEEALQRAAVNNAHHAIEAARAKAQAFNQPANTSPAPDAINMDDGEMNFQNPTSLGDVDIEQPKLLSCQLKEYQLKGLNWLCNLYEQGINGILADEMGLGKTVQSISVMAYLAEYHNIWGPFLVVAPASTLHNWQQEIAKFVPAFKAIPYWGNAKDRKTLRRFWDRKSVTYTRDSPMHIVITSYQIVVQDAQYFQRMKWQYMILDEAQAIKSSSSSRWKALLGFHCRNRLLLTGTPIQNSMQELWALLHFIMPSLFDSHDEFSEWFSKDIESHAQSNTQLNEAQLKRLHMILKPFMLRRVKKHVQKELGDKVELDVFCDLTYRQRSIYQNLRAKISVMDLIEKAAMGGDENTATLMNLVMQFRKVCNHPDLFERADIRAPLALTSWGETASFMREGSLVEVPYTARNKISYRIPALVYREGGRLEIPGNDSDAGTRRWVLQNLCSIWKPDYIQASTRKDGGSPFAWLRFSDCSVGEVSATHSKDALERMEMVKRDRLGRIGVAYEEEKWSPAHSMFQIAPMETLRCNASITEEGVMAKLLNISTDLFHEQRLHVLDPMFYDRAAAPPIGLDCLNQGAVIEQQTTLFNDRIRRHLFGPSPLEETHLIERKIAPTNFPPPPSLPRPLRSDNTTSIEVPSMSRFVTDSGKLATLDRLLTRLKTEGHRVLLYFQMTRMMDLCEEYLTYRHHKYLRLDGSSKLEDRRDMVSAWQTNPDYFVFILSTRAGGLGINLTAADTVIFYDSDWNPTIDSQAMDRAHRLGQTKQVTVYRLITRNTIEERIRMRAQQKEEVQRVVIQGGGSSTKNVDFKGSREVATWLFEDGDAEEMEKRLARKQEEVEAMKARGKGKGGRKKKEGVAGRGVNIEDMYHEGEGNFDSTKPSEAGTPAPALPNTTGKKRAKGKGNKKKTTQERLNMIDGTMDVKMGGV